MKRIPLFLIPLIALPINLGFLFIPIPHRGWPDTALTPLSLAVSLIAAGLLLTGWKQRSRLQKDLLGSGCAAIVVTALIFIGYSVRLLYRFKYDPTLQQDDLASLEWIIPLIAYLAHLISLVAASILAGAAQLAGRRTK